MNALDIGILIIVGLFAIDGLRRGFLLGLLDLVALVLAIVIGGQFAVTLGEQLRRFGLSAQLANGAGFVIAAVVSLAVIGLVGRILLSPIRALSAGTPLAWANSVLGLLPGALRGVALAALLVNILLILPPELVQRVPVTTSQIALPIARAGRDALNAGLMWARIDPAQIFSPGSPPRVPTTPIPITEVVAVESDPGAEESLLAMINSDRASSGVAPLRADSALAEIARAHARDMLGVGARDATPPAIGVSAPLSGENRTNAATVEIAHAKFMSSPADRANIFNAGFTRAGIAVLRRDDKSVTIVEVFAGP
jgi:uncharacterized membrane protein required for colicin V production